MKWRKDHEPSLSAAEMLVDRLYTARSPFTPGDLQPRARRGGGIAARLHERLTPNQAVKSCKEAEKFHMFVLEDPSSPEDLGYFQQIPQNCATPIATGELFNNPHEWQYAALHRCYLIIIPESLATLIFASTMLISFLRSADVTPSL